MNKIFQALACDSISIEENIITNHDNVIILIISICTRLFSLLTGSDEELVGLIDQWTKRENNIKVNMSI